MALRSQTCRHCNTTYMADERLEKDHYISFDPQNFSIGGIILRQYRCPHCQKVSLFLTSNGGFWGGNFSYVYPPTDAMFVPEYIPEALRQDYFEAIQIVDLSPKSAATLARRCLQGMIHDFWGIKEKNLNAEITALKSRIPRQQWEALDAIRRVGNIGAHMEKDVQLIIDVDSDEAKKLLRVIELLFKTWYINAHEESELCEAVKEMADAKDESRSAAKHPNGQ